RGSGPADSLRCLPCSTATAPRSRRPWMSEAVPRAPWRRRVGTAPKTWVGVMAVAVCVGWLPFAGRPLSPDEAGYLIVGGQWSPGSSLYGAYWVDRPPLLIALFGLADAL